MKTLLLATALGAALLCAAVALQTDPSQETACAHPFPAPVTSERA